MDIQKEWYQYEAKDNDKSELHRAQTEELAFYHAVSSGDLDYVRKNCEEQRFIDNEGVGTLSKDPVTNLKYHFVITAALVVRSCVAAGMEMEQAYRLSDFYIQKLDNILNTRDVSKLHDTLVLDFTERMYQIKSNSSDNRLINQCVEYIYVHIKERITIDDLVEHTGISASHLSHQFKLEMGMSISDYIRKKKIEKSQNLLKFCDYSLVSIANYLSFSSQSHFTQVFQKQVGMTPKKYRDLHSKTSWDNTDN